MRLQHTAGQSGVKGRTVGSLRTSPPLPATIKEQRRAANLTQAEAATLVHSHERRWREWEAGAHKMAPGLWELFLLKVAQLAEDRA